MAEVDTSSYLNPTAQPSLLDTVGKFQGLEAQRLGIDQNKLKLMSEHMAIAVQEMSQIANDPAPTQEKAKARLDNLAKITNMPAPVYQRMMGEFQGVGTDPNAIREWGKSQVVRGMNTEQMLHKVYGVNGFTNDGQNITPTLTKTGEGPVPSGPPIAVQPPPTTPVIGADNRPGLLGAQSPQLPPGAVPAPGGLPGQFIPQNRLPVALPAMPPPNASAAPPPVLDKPQDRVAQGIVGAPPGTFQPRGPVTGFAPGVAEAKKVTGAASGEALANARKAAEHYQQDLLPLTESIAALEKLGTKGTGPGTETINNLKSFIISNLPNVKPDDFKGLDNVAAYDKAKKYLVQIARTQGSTGTNDQLAAAFSGNPSVNMSNAAATDVAKSILALRKMQQAQLLIFEKSGLPEDQFSSWAAKNQNSLDPRAFGFDQMAVANRKKLIDGLKGPEKEKFVKSLQFAHDAQLIEPPGR